MIERRIEYAMPMDWKGMSQEKGKLAIIWVRLVAPGIFLEETARVGMSQRNYLIRF